MGQGSLEAVSPRTIRGTQPFRPVGCSARCGRESVSLGNLEARKEVGVLQD